MEGAFFRAGDFSGFIYVKGEDFGGDEELDVDLGDAGVGADAGAGYLKAARDSDTGAFFDAGHDPLLEALLASNASCRAVTKRVSGGNKTRLPTNQAFSAGQD